MYIILILLLYYRTYKYNRLIDDPVPRDGYLYELPRKVNYKWYDEKRSLLATAVNVGTFIATCGYIHILWGYKAALLYSVFPLNVSSVAWTTGNYYMSTVLLCLAAFCYIDHTILSLLFYAAALNSTLISLPFFLCLNPFHILPVVTFLTGKRFRTGIKQRKKSHKEIGMRTGFHISHIFHVPRTIAYYIFMSFYPIRLGFFHEMGKLPHHKVWKWWWLSWVVILVFILWGVSIDWKLTLYWLICMAPFCQLVVYGQFVTERYTPLANVFFCVLMAKFLPNELFYIVGTLYFCRSLIYIPAWKSNERLFGYSTTQFKGAQENWVNLGSYYIERNDTFSAIKPLLLAERVAQGEKYGIYKDIASCYLHNGFYQKALEWTDKALEIVPPNDVEKMTEQKDKIQEKIDLMVHSQKKLKKLGII